MRFFHWPWLPVIVTSVVLIGCQKGSEAPKERVYDVKGTVVSVDPKKPSVRLDHQVIPGLMEAMVMEFEVTGPKVL
jgi:Copper binding periplasmic protein CusF